MPRKGHIQKRDVLADPLYNNKVVTKLPVLWVYFLLCTDEFVKWPWVIKHYREGKWAKNITREEV